MSSVGHRDRSLTNCKFQHLLTDRLRSLPKVLCQFTAHEGFNPNNLVRRVLKLDRLKTRNLADNLAAKCQELIMRNRSTVDPKISDLQENGDLLVDKGLDTVF